MSTLREQLIQIQKRNYRKKVRLVRKTLKQNRGLELYREEYLRYLKDYEAISNKADLVRKASAADVIFHGDYHTLKQSQSAVLHILQDIQGKRDMVLCLEIFHGSDQKHVDAFLAGELTEDSFLKKIDYAKKWPFAWENWKPTMSFCRDHKIPILGINTETSEGNGMRSLKKRDQYSARIIAKAFLRNPGKLIYVVDGDLHIAPNHLPKNVERLLAHLDEHARFFFIFQNAETLYWKLCSRGLEESDVLRIRENMYCVMNTMPANKIQSYLNWLEYSEDAYFPVSKEWEFEDYEHRGAMVHDMVTSLASILNLDLPADALQKLTIFYPNDLQFMERLYEMPELKGRLRLIKDKIKRGEGFLLEYDGEGETRYLIYLANSNINMAAEEACHFLNAVLRGPLTKGLSPFDRFYRNVITECLGFFGSKFLNEKRKTESENSIRRFLGRVKRGEEKETDLETIQVARYILQHRYLQRQSRDPQDFMKKFHAQYKSRSAVSRMFSTQLGYMLGNKLYYAVKRGAFSIETLRGLFCDPFEKPMQGFTSYLDISDRIQKVKLASGL
jgi:hypothetical protein